MASIKCTSTFNAILLAEYMATWSKLSRTCTSTLAPCTVLPMSRCTTRTTSSTIYINRKEHKMSSIVGITWTSAALNTWTDGNVPGLVSIWNATWELLTFTAASFIPDAALEIVLFTLITAAIWDILFHRRWKFQYFVTRFLCYLLQHTHEISLCYQVVKSHIMYSC